MKLQVILGVSLLTIPIYASAQIKEGKICHADPEVTEYNYAGVWEKFEDGWICNYWQFLSEDEWEEVIIEEGMEVETEE